MKIISKTTLCQTQNSKTTKIVIEAPLIAQKVFPGQFVIVMAHDVGERIPLTVVEANQESGEITLIFQELGFTTKALGGLNPGDFLYAILGPLGNSTKITKHEHVILIGGGVGIAEIYPVAKAFSEAQNKVTTIIGARTKDLLILENELRNISDELLIATDDGTRGKKGFVTDALKEFLSSTDSCACSLVYAVGPIPMMESIAKVTKKNNIETLVSLNALMVDGTGMCGCCRVTIGNETKFTCVDGPEFDASLVDWEELVNRGGMYKEKENHICKLKLPDTSNQKPEE